MTRWVGFVLAGAIAVVAGALFLACGVAGGSGFVVDGSADGSVDDSSPVLGDADAQGTRTAGRPLLPLDPRAA